MPTPVRRALSLAMSIVGPALAALVVVIDTGKRW
jgi:hypothetical protein